MGSYSSALEKIADRLEKHTEGRAKSLLAGFNFDDKPTQQVDGESDLPNVRLFVPDLSEQFRERELCKATLGCNLAISTKISEGCVEHLKAVEKVLDAVELDADTGEVDVTLEGTVRQPFSLKSAEPRFGAVSITTEVSLVFTPRKTPRRGKRSTL